VGTEARQIRTEKGRSPNQESYCSEADESGSAEEVIGSRESAMGFEEAGWCEDSIEPKSMTSTFRFTGCCPFSPQLSLPSRNHCQQFRN
jgi:hypothetical protein